MEIDEAKLVNSLQRWRKAVEDLGEIEEELYKEGWLVFTSKIMSGNRISVPLEVMQRLDLKLGDRVLVPLSRLSKREGM